MKKYLKGVIKGLIGLGMIGGAYQIGKHNTLENHICTYTEANRVLSKDLKTIENAVNTLADSDDGSFDMLEKTIDDFYQREYGMTQKEYDKKENAETIKLLQKIWGETGK
tara:strand:- start:1909 stop:2238 length:330 start_codon:yes stop_codon:yes gene_type:complete